MFKEAKYILIIIGALVFVTGGVLMAGTIMTQTENPSYTGYTLEDIYQKVSSSTYINSAHTLSPSVSTSTNSMYSVDDIFRAIPAYKVLAGSTTTVEAGIYATTTLADVLGSGLLPENIAAGTTTFGITGTFICTPPAQ